jgi:hypothetical protein
LSATHVGHFVPVLTDRERRLLEEISADIEQSDPRLAARLGGYAPRRWRARWQQLRPGVAAAAVPGGLALTVATFPWSTWVAFAGVSAAFWGCNVSADRAWARIVGLGNRIRGSTHDRDHEP